MDKATLCPPLGKRYGDVTYFHGLGYNVLVLNTMNSINDLLEKRADIYSHRPRFVLGGELMGLDQSTPLLNYGPDWREHRKLAHGSLSLTAVKQYHHVQENIAAVLCKELLDDPTNFYNIARLAAGRIVMSVTYGLSVDAGSEYIKQTEDVMDVAGKTIVPAAHLCDVLPALKYLPSWVPFRSYAQKWKARIENDVRKGTAVSSLATDLLSAEAGMETHPDKQRLAQAELDLLLQEENRMPLISDMPKLPYVSALIKETLRWHPILPFSIARHTDVDDEYLGHRVAKGTIPKDVGWADPPLMSWGWEKVCILLAEHEHFSAPNYLPGLCHIVPRSIYAAGEKKTLAALRQDQNGDSNVIDMLRSP
ncbi:hypothetical protein MPER_10316 [Moniliophthora perniciosa FA553]|nr:hypothetical protein MPER_10316 [Moniliophthora perniciosa FA553]